MESIFTTERNENLVQILNQTDLNWEVRKERNQTASGILLDTYSTIRSDKNIVLGDKMGKDYQPYQNYDFIELLEKVSMKTGLPLHKGGHFDDGSKIYIQLLSDELKIPNVGGNIDRVKGFVTGINSFNGTASLSFGPSSITISCQNTFWKAYKDLEKIKHTKNMLAKIDIICQRIDSVLLEEKEMFSDIIKMSETTITQRVKDKVINTLFEVPANFMSDESVKTRKRNQIIAWEGDFITETAEKGENLWGLFSSVTKYTTHTMKSKDNMENKIFGGFGSKERQIFTTLVNELN